MSGRDDSDPVDVIAFIRTIFAERGADAYLGEQVTMSEHMLQSALLAETEGADDELVAAALLHDIGHFHNDFPDDAFERSIDNRHEDAGAGFLSGHFPELVVDCVRHHVAAKRYLCAVDAGYFDILSPASVHTLELQGGPMDDTQVQEFASQPHLESILQVRRFDERAKVPGCATPELDYYIPLLQRLRIDVPG